MNYDMIRVQDAAELDREMGGRPGWKVVSVVQNSFGGMGYIAWLERIEKEEPKGKVFSSSTGRYT